MLKIRDINSTPNPSAIKFVVNEQLSRNGVIQYDNVAAAKNDPLAKALFNVEGVESVFYSQSFLTVSKSTDKKWEDLQPKLITVIESQEAPSVESASPQTEKSSEKQSGDELLDQINHVIDQNVRPALEGDGGGLEILSLDGHILTIHYQGACGSCPSSSQGTMMAIQNLLRATVDPRIQVISDQY